tara:strand:+ start:21587 stop:22246 length:660 start_codon:yes stop_codon:yes gene_type:complete
MKAIIFDFDGVIIDSEPLRYATYKKLFLEEYNITIPEDFKKVIGKKQEDNLKHFLQLFELQGDINDLVNKRKLLLKSTFADSKNIIPIKGIQNILIKLHQRGIKLAIATSSTISYVQPILEYLNISQYFSSIVTGPEVINGKPAPDIFKLAAQKLNLHSEDCLVIEDSIAGIKAAKSAKMSCYAITTYLDAASFEQENYTFADYTEPELINKLESIFTP